MIFKRIIYDCSFKYNRYKTLFHYGCIQCQSLWLTHHLKLEIFSYFNLNFLYAVCHKHYFIWHIRKSYKLYKAIIFSFVNVVQKCILNDQTIKMTRKFQVWNYSEPYYQMYPDTWVCTALFSLILCDTSC